MQKINKKGVEADPKSNLFSIIMLVLVLFVVTALIIKFSGEASAGEKTLKCSNNTFLFETAWCVENENDCPGMEEGYQLASKQYGCDKNEKKTICCYKMKTT